MVQTVHQPLFEPQRPAAHVVHFLVQRRMPLWPLQPLRQRLRPHLQGMLGVYHLPGEVLRGAQRAGRTILYVILKRLIELVWHILLVSWLHNHIDLTLMVCCPGITLTAVSTIE